MSAEVRAPWPAALPCRRRCGGEGREEGLSGGRQGRACAAAHVPRSVTTLGSASIPVMMLAPRSTPTDTPASLLVHTRPPTRSRASRTTGEKPLAARWRAAARPAGPAPMMSTRLGTAFFLRFAASFSRSFSSFSFRFASFFSRLAAASAAALASACREAMPSAGK